MVVAGEETVERGLRVPLELQQFPAGLELQGEPPTLVDVRVRGSSGALEPRRPGRHRRRPRPARRRGRGGVCSSSRPKQVRTPFGVEVVQVAPVDARVRVRADRRRDGCRLSPSVEGDPAPGFVVGTMTADPATVEITGPESAVKRATEAVTEPVSVAGRASATWPRTSPSACSIRRFALKGARTGDGQGPGPAWPARAHGPGPAGASSRPSRQT